DELDATQQALRGLVEPALAVHGAGGPVVQVREVIAGRVLSELAGDRRLARVVARGGVVGPAYERIGARVVLPDVAQRWDPADAERDLVGPPRAVVEHRRVQRLILRQVG